MTTANSAIMRHTLSDRIIHWSNAILWIALLITGIALIDHPTLSPFGRTFPAWARSVAGGGKMLLTIHITCACMWIGCLLCYLVINWRGAKFFLREVFRIVPGDGTWLFRKMFHMLLGKRLSSRLGVPLELPDQGYYNAGQKAFAVASVVGSVCLAGSGALLALSSSLSEASYPFITTLVGWSITMHHFSAGLVMAGLFVHIYMAALSPDERPGLFSMFTGSVPESYAKHHHPLWKYTPSGLPID